MANSVFIEHNTPRVTDSNLVVVFSKNGVNCDHQALRNLIEEKTLSSISVLRITSPTPSMLSEEERFRKEEEEYMRQDEDSDDDSNLDADDTSNSDKNKSTEPSDKSDFEKSIDEDADNSKQNGGNRRRRYTRKSSRQSRAASVQKTEKKKRFLERPKLKGLTFEEFYPPDEAKAVAQQILKAAGIPTVKRTEEHARQMVVIKNDHCYTPFTSPDQMKEKILLDKAQQERQVILTRKIITPNLQAAKLITKRKLTLAEHQKLFPNARRTHNYDHRKANNELDVDDDDANLSDLEDYRNKEVSVDGENGEDSADVDNDRDSDLDYRINHRQIARGRKSSILKKTKPLLVKSPCRQQNQEDSVDSARIPDVKTPEKSTSLDAKPLLSPIVSLTRLLLPTAEKSQTIIMAKPASTTNAPSNKDKFIKISGTRLINTSEPSIVLQPQKGLQSSKPIMPTKVIQQSTIVDPPIKVIQSTKLDQSNKIIQSHKMPQQIKIIQSTKVNEPTKTTFQSVKVIETPKVAVQSVKVIEPPRPAAVAAQSVKVIEVPKSTAVQSVKATETPTVPKLVQPTTTPTTIITKSPIIHATPTIINKAPAIQLAEQKSNVITKIAPIFNKPVQNVKEIIINKVISTPKRGFTELSTFLADAEQKTTFIDEPIQPRLKTPSKGFVPLGVDTATKTKLPAQISIQTHQSSSEIAAENDKQLDLIDSIVKCELEKEKTQIEETKSINENIPELVKMLESIEQETFESKANVATISNPKEDILATGSNLQNNDAIDDDIDISQAPLLDTAVDELNEDLLNHVVELINDDKTLAEAVEKNALIENSGEIDVGDDYAPQQMLASNIDELKKPTCHGSVFAMNNLTANETFTPAPSPCKVEPKKSIIQIALYNPGLPPIKTGLEEVESNKLSSITKSNNSVQVMRSDGRIVILPPIDPPNTRAKRRQNNSYFDVNDLDNSNASSFLEINSMDSSLSERASRSRRVSKESVSSGTTTGSRRSSSRRASKRPAKKSAKSSAKTENEFSESQDDDDDPNKLWCLCRQPHNNRFMICCDSCADWFHGTCVNVTKNMGLEMEENGVDWKCPKCLKMQDQKGQKKITDMLPVITTKQREPALPKDNKLPIADPVNTYSTSPLSNSSETLVSTAPNNLPVTSSIFDTPPSITSSSAENVLISSTNLELTKMPADVNTNYELKTTNNDETVIQPIVKRPKIEIQSVQTGQFISLENLESLKKPPFTVVTSGQRKYYAPTTITTATTIIPSTTTSITTPTTPTKVIPIKEVNKTTVTIPKKIVKKIIPKMSSVKIIPPIETGEAKRPCIVCKKASRGNTLYCSDDCIRRYVQNSLNILQTKTPEASLNQSAVEEKKKSKGLFEDLLSMADLKPKVKRVNVVDRRNNRVLTGTLAPTTTQLKKWLQENPTFEVILPGSKEAMLLEKKQKQQPPNKTEYVAATIHCVTTASASNNITNTSHITPSKNNSVIETKVPQGAVSPTDKFQGRKTPTPADKLSGRKTPTPADKLSGRKTPTPADKLQGRKTPTPSDKLLGPKTPTRTPATPKKITQRRSSFKIKDEVKSTEKTPKTKNGRDKDANKKSNSTNDEFDPIRQSICQSIKQDLIFRMDLVNKGDTEESDAHPKLTVEEIEEYATKTENALYELFNRDTGHRYKNKYRSLIFNIRDRKNNTLFAKICAKEIEPDRLVRMSPEEMASQELALWRINENKHILDVITSSELELMSSTKQIVLKSHKGEEVIKESKLECSLDSTISTQDIVTALNKTETYLEDVDATDSMELKSHDVAILEKEKEEKEREKEMEKLKEKERVDREREKELEREHEREKERQRELEKEKEREHEKQKEYEREMQAIQLELQREMRAREKQMERENEREREKQREREKEREREKQRERQIEIERELERERVRAIEIERERERQIEIEREKERELEREREKERELERGREKERELERGREKDRRERDKERERRHKSKDKKRSRSRSHRDRSHSREKRHSQEDKNREREGCASSDRGRSRETGRSHESGRSRSRSRHHKSRNDRHKSRDDRHKSRNRDGRTKSSDRRHDRAKSSDSGHNREKNRNDTKYNHDSKNSRHRNSDDFKSIADDHGNKSPRVPSSPKRRRHINANISGDEDIDIDAIIKAPIISRNAKKSMKPILTITDDPDEPYSPGDDSNPLNDENASSAIPTTPGNSINLEMDLNDINRDIEVREKEFAALLKKDERTGYAQIDIPADLSQILQRFHPSMEEQQQPNTTKTTTTPTTPYSMITDSGTNADDEYVPESAYLPPIAYYPMPPLPPNLPPPPPPTPPDGEPFNSFEYEHDNDPSCSLSNIEHHFADERSKWALNFYYYFYLNQYIP